MPDDKSERGKRDRSCVEADQDYEVQHFAYNYGLSPKQIRHLIARLGSDRERLEAAAEELIASGGVVELYPPVIDSAVGIGPYTIKLNFHYRRTDLSKFRFKRTHAALGITQEFQVDVNPGSYNRTFNDNPLDPATTYKYQIGAVHPSGDPEWIGIYWNTPQIPVSATTFDTAGESTFENTLSYDSEGWEGYCLVQRIEPHALSKSGTQVRVTLRASSTAPYGAFIDSIYISRPASGGKQYDSASDLTEIAPKFDVQGGEALTLSWIRYILDAEQPLLIAVNFKPQPWPSAIAYRPVKTQGPGGQPIVPAGVAYWRTGAEAALTNRSTNYEAENRIYLIEKIEVR
jgi:hypothetical protein